MRLIEANTLIQRLEKASGMPLPGWIRKEIIDAPTFEPKAKWTLCSEALSECELPAYDFTDVLVYARDENNDPFIIQAYLARGHWVPTLAIDMSDLDVIAWMPIPSLPD